MSRVCVRKGRFYVCTLLLVAGFLVLGGRLVWLQAVRAEEIAESVEPVRKRLFGIPARRGDILDRNGDLLAGTRSRIRLGVDPETFRPEDQGKLALLAGILDIPFAELEAKTRRRTWTDSEGRERPVRWVPLAEIDEELYRAVREADINGVYGNRHYERYYPGRELAAHVLGYLNREDTPVMGVERALDYYLRGQAGWRETEVDGHRQELAAYRNREVEARNGLHVRLTLDLFVQATVEKELARLVEEMSPQGASILVSRPGSGDILALANYPTFDPNRFPEYPIAHQRNRAVSDQIEPGSTFKIVTVAAALEEGVVQPSTLIDCSRKSAEYDGRRIPLPEDSSPLGKEPVRRVLVKSSNRGAAQIGMLLGETRMHDWAARFGFGREPVWPLPGAVPGQLHSVKDWDGYTISRLPTGYAVGATPLQIHLATAAIANGGLAVAPRLFLDLQEENPTRSLPLGRSHERKVISEDTAKQMRTMLNKVATREGTARRARIPGYAVAGKTGTTRKLVDGRYSPRHHVSTFTGFFPAPDPEVVITVIVDDADPEGLPAYGGVVAAPVFRRIGEALIPHLAIRKPHNWQPFLVKNE